MLDVRAIRVQRAVGVKRDELERLGRGVHLQAGRRMGRVDERVHLLRALATPPMACWLLAHGDLSKPGYRTCGSLDAQLQSPRMRTATLSRALRAQGQPPRLPQHPHLRDVQDVSQLRKVGGHVLAAGEGEELVVLHEGVHQPGEGGERAGLRLLACLEAR